MPLQKIPGAGVDVALELAGRGVKVFPITLSWNEARKKWEKKPIGRLVPKGHLNASADPAVIEAWSREAPDCRWGAVADIFVLIDIDGAAALTKAKDLGLPTGAVLVPTAREGGFHIHCRPFAGAASWSGKSPGIDSRGGGSGWAVIYRPFDPAQLPEAPEWFCNLTRFGESQPIQDGQRNDALCRIAGRLWSQPGTDEDHVVASLEQLAILQVVGTPVPAKDIRRIAKGIGKKELAKPPRPTRSRAGTMPERSEGAPPTPWKGRSGWEIEKEVPILTKSVQNTETKEWEDVPLENAYVLYNNLVTEHGLRAFRTVHEQLRVAVPSPHGLRVLDPVPDSRGRSRFMAYVRYRFYVERGQPVPRADLTKVAEVFEGRAADSGLPSERVVDLSLRLAPRPGLGCILDLADDAQRCVVLGPEGWRTEEVGYPIFDRKPHMLPLPAPVHPSSIAEGVAEILQYILLPKPEKDGPRQGENQRLLFIAAQVMRLLYPDSPKPGHVLAGEQNVGKTQMAILDQALTDPSRTGILPPPSEKDREDALRTFLLNRSTLNFDNISHITRELSDDLCRLITGAGQATRKKYSDGDEVTISSKPQVILNGIGATPEAADLLRRCLLFKPVSPESLGIVPLDPFVLRAKFDAAHPRLLGTLLDLAVAVAKEIEKPQDPPFANSRDMQAFFLVGQAVAKVLGWAPAAFVKAFEMNLADQGFAAAQTLPVQALIAFWRGRATTMPATSADIATWIRSSEFGVSFTTPPNAHSVGKLMDRSRPTLEQNGLYIAREVGHASQVRWSRADRPHTPRTLSSGRTPPTPPLESFGVFPPSEKEDGGVVEGLGGVAGPTPPDVEGLTPPSSASISATPPSGLTSENSPSGGVGGVGGVGSETQSSSQQERIRAVIRALQAAPEGVTLEGLSEASGMDPDGVRRALKELDRVHAAFCDPQGRWRPL